MKTVLTIAGSDTIGGAGIQADIKTMITNGVYGMSVITALTAQNTMEVSAIYEVTPEFLSKQIDAVFTDIFPDAVKIGMVSSAELIYIISDKLSKYNAQNIVVDPVMISTSGSKLIDDNAIKVLQDKIFPMSSIITPNIPESETISGIKIKCKDDMISSAKWISENYNCAVLCKGGHNSENADDLLYKDGKYKWFCGERINNINTHGTGCTLSSAIASNIAKGMAIDEAVHFAKKYISNALSAMLDIGKGNGPLNHAFFMD